MTDERRRADDARFAALDARCGNIEKCLAENTAITAGVKADTAAIVEAWTAIAGGLKVLGVLGKVAKWATYLVSLAAAVWALLHGQRPSL